MTEGYPPKFVALFGGRDTATLEGTRARLLEYIADPTKALDEPMLSANLADIDRLLGAEDRRAELRAMIEERAPGLCEEADAIGREPGRQRTSFDRLVDIASERRIAAGS